MFYLLNLHQLLFSRRVEHCIFLCGTECSHRWLNNRLDWFDLRFKHRLVLSFLLISCKGIFLLLFSQVSLLILKEFVECSLLKWLLLLVRLIVIWNRWRTKLLTNTLSSYRRYIGFKSASFQLFLISGLVDEVLFFKVFIFLLVQPLMDRTTCTLILDVIFRESCPLNWGLVLLLWWLWWLLGWCAFHYLWNRRGTWVR